MVVDVILIITPVKGKEARAEELMSQQIEVIKKDEPGLLIDRCYKRANISDHTEYVIFQRYEDEEAYNAHFHTEHYTSLPGKIEDEEVLAKPMVYMKLEAMQFGFER